MSKKILSIILSVVMLMGTLVVGAYAFDPDEEFDDYQAAVKWNLLTDSYGSARSEASFTALVAEWEAADPDIVERNLAFWDDEVINAYHNATTQDDWKELYQLMNSSWAVVDDSTLDGEYDWATDEPEELVDYIPEHLNSGHHPKVSIKYTTDKATAEVGDIITVTVNVKTNFYFNTAMAGFAYDKTKLEYVADSASYVAEEGVTWKYSGACKNTYGFTDSGVDCRYYQWPIQMRDNQDGCYDKVGMVKAMSTYDIIAWADGTAPCGRICTDYTPMYTFQMKVLDTAEDGDVLSFYAPDNAWHRLAEQHYYDNGDEGFTPVLLEFDRCNSAIVRGMPGECTDYEFDWEFETASVTIGSDTPSVEYADYTALDAAIADKDNLVEANYTAASWAVYANAVTAGSSLARDLVKDEQATVDAATKAITDAKAALKEPADYTALDAAIADKDTLVEANYTAASWVVYANAVTAGGNVARDLTKDDQATVDAATKAITDAKAALKEPADYAALNAAIQAFDDATDEADYKPATWAAYKTAVTDGKAVDKNLTKDDQATVDAAATAITTAKTALVKNEVVSAEVVGTPVIGSEANVKVTVTGAPTFVRLSNDGKTYTFVRNNATIVEVDGGEEWTVKVLVESELTTFDVDAKYATYTENSVSVQIEAQEGLDLSIHSFKVVDMYPDEMNGGVVLKGKHDIVITTSQDVYKIQFVEGDIAAGGTYTYCAENKSGNCTYVDLENGERQWTIKHAFGPTGELNMPIRTRAESTTFAATGDYLIATVVY